MYEYSGGIPRTINVLCDNALVTAVGLGKRRVDSQVVLEVARDFDLGEARSRDFRLVPSADEVDQAAQSPWEELRQGVPADRERVQGLSADGGDAGVPTTS